MIDFTFTDTLTPRLEAAQAACVDFGPAMAVIADYMRTSTVDRFDEQAGPDGIKWTPSRRAIDDGGLTLTDRGHLRHSITAASDSNSAIAGTNIIYAAIHQFGGRITARGSANGGARALKTPFGPRGAVTLPARPFMGFSIVDIIEIETVLIEHIDRALNAGGAA